MGRVRARGERTRSTAPHADAHAGPPNWINKLPAGNSILWRLPGVIVPRPPAIHDGLVVATPNAVHIGGDDLLVLAKIAQQIGPPELVMNAAPTQRTSIMICKALAMCSGLSLFGSDSDSFYHSRFEN